MSLLQEYTAAQVPSNVDALNEQKEDLASPPSELHALTDAGDEKTESLNDNQFHALLQKQLHDVPGRNDYPEVYEISIDAMVKWRRRYRGNPKLWQRIFRKDKVFKELIESAPIIDMVMKYVESYSIGDSDSRKKITIMDLCSGKGYLSMFLSEILPHDKVEKLILVDKAWACYNATELRPHHMSSEHIYGNVMIGETVEENENNNGSCPTVLDSDLCQPIGEESSAQPTYFETWPIPLHASKQDLKAGRNKRQMKKYYFDKIEGPIIVLAIHLCGTLSLRAVDMFNNHDNVKLFALKPCCLPGMIHAKRKVVFKIGQHEFKAEEVCSHGEFNKGSWSGPNRRHLAVKFDRWAEHLFNGVDISDNNSADSNNDGNTGKKAKENIGK